MTKFAAASHMNMALKHVDVHYDSKHECVWIDMQYPERPCMTPALLEDMARAQQSIRLAAEGAVRGTTGRNLAYQVLCSSRPGVFNLGGDLEYFIALIKRRDRDELFDYAKTCIDILYPSITCYGLPFTTISLVQGEALGGGFEAALSGKVLIAEEGSTFGFPETLFGMFPGMGAFSFLSRRLSPVMAKRIIASGKVYSAYEMYELGVVDILARPGKGREAVSQYIRHQATRTSGFLSLDRVVDQFNPISYQELLDIVTIWVDTAMGLGENNLRLMKYLVRAQRSRWVETRAPEEVAMRRAS